MTPGAATIKYFWARQFSLLQAISHCSETALKNMRATPGFYQYFWIYSLLDGKLDSFTVVKKDFITLKLSSLKIEFITLKIFYEGPVL